VNQLVTIVNGYGLCPHVTKWHGSDVPETTTEKDTEAARRLALRLEKALERRSALAKEAGEEEWTVYTVHKQSGISYAQVTRLFGRSEAGPTRGKHPRRETIIKLATALLVSPDWLADGAGPMVPAATRKTEKVDRYASRPDVVAMARQDGMPEDALTPVLAMELDSDEDPGPFYWMEQIQAQRTLLRGKAILGTRVRVEDAPKPRGPRKRTDT
jgi:hypothetical protein